MSAPMTPAEDRVLRLRAEGLSVKAVAGVLGISDQTVKNHITSAYASLDVDNFASALRKLGWLRPPGADPILCGFVGTCGRKAGHRGHHGGFRAIETER